MSQSFISETEVTISTDSPVLGTTEQPLSVSELTELIKSSLEKTFHDVILTGEISNFKHHPSGHFYFSLKDSTSTISAVMFRQANAKLKFKPCDGQKIIAFGRVTVYPPRGSYQIMLHRMEPDGLGALQLAFEQLKKKLEAAGFFDTKRKRVIPRFPRKVGVVTSPSGAAIRDILHVLHRRFAGLHILIYPVKVQGEGSAEEIAEAIQHFNAFFPDIDVMIVGRGGGSIEDLWAFNEEVVAQAIYNSRIPIISAVGHEVDFTIADFVADLRAPTPSAAAELVIGSRYELIQHLDHLTKRLSRVTSRLEMASLKVDDLVNRLRQGLREKVSYLQRDLEKFRLRLSHSSPIARLSEMRHRAALFRHRLEKVPERLFEKNRWKLQSLESKLKLLNPRSIMERGYSIVRIEKTNKVVKKVSDVRMGDRLIIEVWKGKISARI